LVHLTTGAQRKRDHVQFSRRDVTDAAALKDLGLKRDML